MLINCILEKKRFEQFDIIKKRKMNIEQRATWMTDSKKMILVDKDQCVCFTRDAQLAYACPLCSTTKPDPNSLPNNIEEEMYLNVYLNSETIDFLKEEEFKARPIFTKEKHSKIEAYVVTVKNAFNKHLLRFKIQSLENAFQYTSFMNACIINNKLQLLIKATPHIGLLYFSRFIDMGEISILFGLDETKLFEQVYGFQALEDVGTKSAKTYIKEWIHLIQSKIAKKKDVQKVKHKFDVFLRSLMFRIIYTLHCILLRYPGFRHNDLHLDNIIMSESESQKDSIYETENDLSFTISHLLSFPRMIDFGWSSMCSRPSKDGSSQCESSIKPIGLNIGLNHYVDLNKFFNNLYVLFEHHSHLLHDQVWKFIQGVVPEPYRVGLHKSKTTELNMSIWSPHSEYMLTSDKKWIRGATKGLPLPEFVSPSQLLMDPIFDMFRTKTSANGTVFSSLKALEVL